MRHGRHGWARPRATIAAAWLAATLLPLVPAEAAVQQWSTGPDIGATLPSLVTLRAYDATGLPTEQGSGFFLADGRIATTARIVTGAERVVAFDVDGRELGTLRGVDTVDEAGDLAILPPPPSARGPSGEASRPGLALSVGQPDVGDPVWVFGSPHGLAGTMTTGLVSGLRDRDGRRWIQISAALSSGSSGGPVLDRAGRVIGIAVARLSGGQNLNFAVPAEALDRLAAVHPRGSATAAAFPADPSDRPARGGPRRDWYVDSPELRPGQRLRAAIGDRDYEHEGRPYDMYWFTGTAGQDVEISVTSTALDPYVVLTRADELDAERPWSVVDDDGGAGSNALIETELPATGTYVVIVSSVRRTTGPYAVELRDRPLPDRWEFIARNASDADLYFDRRTLREADGLLRVWIYTLYGRAQKAGEESFDATKALFEFRCGRQEYRLSQYLLMRQDEIVGSEARVAPGPRNEPWTVAAPDTVAEGLLRSVCTAAETVAAG